MDVRKQALSELIPTLFKIEDNPLVLTPGQLEIAFAILSDELKRVWISTTTQYGKSMTVAIGAVLLAARMHKKILIIAPKRDQARIIMRYVLDFVTQSSFLTKGLLDVDTVEKLKTERSKDRLAWDHGGEIMIATAEGKAGTGSGLLGFGADVIIVDESASIPDENFQYILRMLGRHADTKLVEISNPHSRNHFFESSNDSRYLKIHIDYRQAIAEGRLTEVFIEEMRQRMSQLMFKIMYEVLFPDDSDIEGAVYGMQLHDAAMQKRIGLFPYDDKYLVNTAWDLGVDDATSIWFYQVTEKHIRIIDFYENNNFGLEHYIAILKSKPYAYGTHYGPHDLKQREWSVGQSRLASAKDKGILFVPVPNISVADGIEATRVLFKDIVFNQATCDTGLKALHNYKRAFDEKKGTWGEPIHDWASHAADAFRYLALSTKLKNIADTTRFSEEVVPLSYFGMNISSDNDAIVIFVVNDIETKREFVSTHMVEKGDYYEIGAVGKQKGTAMLYRIPKGDVLDIDQLRRHKIEKRHEREEIDPITGY